MEIVTNHKVFYSNKNEVPIPELAEALMALDKVVRQSPPVIEAFFSGTRIQSINVFVDEIKTGSLDESFLIKILFGNQEKFEHFLFTAREKLKIDDLYQNHPILSAIILGMVLYGGLYLINSDEETSQQEKTVIENNYNVVINTGSQMAGIQPEEFKQIIEENIKDRQALAKNSSKFLAPARKDPNATIEFDANPSLEIKAETIKAVPHVFPDQDDIEIVEDYENVEIYIRATDLDSIRRGWAAVIPVINDKRTKLHIDPTISTSELFNRISIAGDVTAIFKINNQGDKVPRLYFLRKIKNKRNKK